MVHPVLVCGIGVFAIAMGSILIKFAQAEAVPPLTIAAWRLGVASLVLLPWTLLKGGEELRRLRRSDVGFVALSGGLLAIHFVAWIRSLELTSQTSSVVLVSTVPVWVALAAPVVLRESTRRGVLLGVALALGGAVVITVSGDADTGLDRPDPLLGNALAILGAWCYAGYLLAGRGLRDRLSLLTYVTLTYAAAAVCAVTAVVAFGSPLAPPTVEGIGWCVLLALIPQLIGHSMLAWALRRMSAAAVSVIALGEPVGAIILAIPMLGLTPTPMRLLGAALILLGIWWVGQRSVGRTEAVS